MKQNPTVKQGPLRPSISTPLARAASALCLGAASLSRTNITPRNTMCVSGAIRRSPVNMFGPPWLLHNASFASLIRSFQGADRRTQVSVHGLQFAVILSH